MTQPPSGGCVLKQALKDAQAKRDAQPPSGGCVLKRRALCCVCACLSAATFGWLCVETKITSYESNLDPKQPPSGGCVLKPFIGWTFNWTKRQPPSGGCVLKQL